MKYEIIDQENKVIKITCTLKDYLNGKLNEYIKIAERMDASKVVIEMDNNH